MSQPPPGTGLSTTPFHCPFCADEDLRPAEDAPTAWACRSCARVFTVTLVRIDHAAIPAPGRADTSKAGAR